MNLDEVKVKGDLCVFFQKENLDIINRWILSRFYSVLKEVNKDLGEYRFNEAANSLYAFFWHEFCDWYLELIKPEIKDAANQVVMYKILEKSLRVMHPFMPFITEEIWHTLTPGGKSIMLEPWPHVQEQIIDAKLEKQAQSIFSMITEIRNLRSSIEIKPEQKVKVSVYAHSKARQNLLKGNAGLITNLARLEALTFLDSSKRPKSAISAVVEDIDVYLEFSGLLDIVREQQKIRAKINSLEKIKADKETRIKNKEFIKKAPREVAEKEKETIAKFGDELKRLEKMLNELH